MSDVIAFPAVEQEQDLNIGCYLGGKNPWAEDGVVLSGTNVATGTVTFKLTRIPAGVLTMCPFDGDYQTKRYQEMMEYLATGGDAATALNMVRCNFDPACSGLLVEPSIGKPFYIARRPVHLNTGAGTLYAQSTIRPQATDGKRGIIYYVMSENDYGEGWGIRWDIKIDHHKHSDTQGGLG